MPAPRLVFDETRWIWRVEYAGMVREHQQHWQALIWYEDARQSYHIGSHKDRPAGSGPLD